MTMARFKATRSQRIISDARWTLTQVLPELLAGLGLIGAALVVPILLLM